MHILLASFIYNQWLLNISQYGFVKYLLSAHDGSATVQAPDTTM